MPIPANEFPPYTARFTLPSVSVGLGQTIQSPSVAVPLNVKTIGAVLDGSAWPVGQVVRGTIEFSNDGGNTWPLRSITTWQKTAGTGNEFSARFVFNQPGNQDAALLIRGAVQPVSGGAITLAGSIGTT